MDLKGITNIWMANNVIEKIPDAISKLDSLEYLYLSHNRIGSLPDSITGLKNLKGISIEHNNLTSLPEDIGGRPAYRDYPGDTGLESLEWIHADHNQITRLPYSMIFMEKLKALHVSHNRLTCIPDLSARVIYARHNRLTYIPALPYLDYLDLSHNHIVRVSQHNARSIRKIGRLRYLNISGNPIQNLEQLREWLPNTEIICRRER